MLTVSEIIENTMQQVRNHNHSEVKIAEASKLKSVSSLTSDLAKQMYKTATNLKTTKSNTVNLAEVLTFAKRLAK